MKELIRLTESDLHTIIKNTVKTMLREGVGNSDAYSDEVLDSISIQDMIDDMQQAIEAGKYDRVYISSDNTVGNVNIFGDYCDYCCDAIVRPDYDEENPDDEIEITGVELYTPEGDEITDVDAEPLIPYFESFIAGLIKDGTLEVERPEYENPDDEYEPNDRYDF